MPLTIICEPRAGLHHETKIARNGLVCAGDVASALAARTNSALGRRQRTITGAAAKYTALTGTAKVLYRFAGHTSTTCKSVIARWVLGPRYAAAASDPMATIQLHTRKTGDAGYKAHPIIYVGATSTAASGNWEYSPDQVSILDQRIEEMTTTSADSCTDLEIDGYIEVAYGARVISFQLVEEQRDTLLSSEGVAQAYSLPGQPIRTDPAATAWTKLAALWGDHGPVIAHQLIPFATSTTSASLVNLVTGAATVGWVAPGVRTTWESLTRLGVTTVPTTFWIAGYRGAFAVALTWKLVAVESDDTETQIATGTITETTVTVQRTTVNWTPASGARSYQMQIASGSAGQAVVCWGWGWYCEGT